MSDAKVAICAFAGSFGHDVAERLRASVGALPVDFQKFSERAQEVRPAFVFVALWRPYPDLCEAIDEYSYRYDVPAAYATLEQSHLYLGPLVVPGATACYNCYRRRRLSHSSTRPRDLALERAYADDPNLGAFGHLPSVAAMAASGLALLSTQMGNAGGVVTRVGIIDSTILRGKTVPIHGCKRCMPRSARAERFVEHLNPALVAAMSDSR